MLDRAVICDIPHERTRVEMQDSGMVKCRHQGFGYKQNWQMY